ncbi:hypothetical protein BDP81DRAFT_86982 [Colletotrichum phormii]|uniref:Uncharacterized protein n=1 Tax=Colletotrichum phormii TaxID=359342 RepID=A0AAJ0A449_9PEZI|nr:uncharacterized protein BDP81DRAFT_86982 [Colletotrichum phormii]KAK1654682.1 hypothetical protein BDP81DRAFT_86982 [Colletotrichum phormii]
MIFLYPSLWADSDGSPNPDGASMKRETGLGNYTNNLAACVGQCFPHHQSTCVLRSCSCDKGEEEGCVVDAAGRPGERKTGRTELGRERNPDNSRLQSAHQREKEASLDQLGPCLVSAIACQSKSLGARLTCPVASSSSKSIGGVRDKCTVLYLSACAIRNSVRSIRTRYFRTREAG